MRLTRITGVDLSLFEFDYDLTWFGFFLSPDEVVYGRYGGRDARSDEGRLSLAGLKYAMEKAIQRHELRASVEAPKRDRPTRVEELKAARARRGNECIHCHQVNEFRRADAKAAGTWSRDALWVYPLPENVGFSLEVDRGDMVRSVMSDSPADKAGLKTGDTIVKLNGYTVASFADAQFALHKAPKSGTISLEWTRGPDPMTGKLELTDGWRKTNLTWRSSLLDILPSLPLSGDELTLEDKKTLGLPAGKAAFRQDKFVHSTLKSAGLKAGDIIVGLNGKEVDGVMDDYLALVRREYLVGDMVRLDIVRDGKPVEIKLTLK